MPAIDRHLRHLGRNPRHCEYRANIVRTSIMETAEDHVAILPDFCHMMTHSDYSRALPRFLAEGVVLDSVGAACNHALVPGNPLLNAKHDPRLIPNIKLPHLVLPMRRVAKVLSRNKSLILDSRPSLSRGIHSLSHKFRTIRACMLSYAKFLY